ncbi:Six-hairpin glycosidase-like protein [Naematelia encephala]|uniref:Six-hairpin glycosidase-like protein n=1 Tax=Naematelia encephala TaxID=71784 RepID=A0A1Y2BLS7_9TREE|nr:Six-hairpin glycosidase-like protein [Naematelia encephala]
MRKVGEPDIWRLDNQQEHFLVIIDNMASMNLDLLYMATELTGDTSYADIATQQAHKSLKAHVRPDYTTNHVVDFNRDGTVKKCMTHQGYDDGSVWSRGQAWAIYGYAQCALRSKEEMFTTTAAHLADKFVELLPPSGVPLWDSSAPQPCPYDASAGTVAARGMQMLYHLLKDTNPPAASYYLTRSFKLVEDIIRECKTAVASLDEAGNVTWGDDGWETILQHSTINGNRHSPRPIMDHGLVYADYYLLEFGNEALKLGLDKGNLKMDVIAKSETVK